MFLERAQSWAEALRLSDKAQLGFEISSAWSESRIENFGLVNLENAKENFGAYLRNVKVLVTLCPLYEPGSLKESQLMKPGVSGVWIEKSRVANKWSAVKKVLTAMQSFLVSIDSELILKAVFADSNVLLAAEPTKTDYGALWEHKEVYRKAIIQFCQDTGINHSYTTYTELGVHGPRFVNPAAEIPEFPGVDKQGLNDSKLLIAQLNAYLEMENVPTQVTDNRRNRNLLDKLHSLGGGISNQEVFWLTSGYLMFDYMIPRLVGANGLYIATERFEPLFGISNMTPQLKAMPRVHLKA